MYLKYYSYYFFLLFESMQKYTFLVGQDTVRFLIELPFMIFVIYLYRNVKINVLVFG